MSILSEAFQVESHYPRVIFNIGRHGL